MFSKNLTAIGVKPSATFCRNNQPENNIVKRSRVFALFPHESEPHVHIALKGSLDFPDVLKMRLKRIFFDGA